MLHLESARRTHTVFGSLRTRPKSILGSKQEGNKLRNGKIYQILKSILVVVLIFDAIISGDCRVSYEYSSHQCFAP